VIDETLREQPSEEHVADGREAVREKRPRST
jgi:hypothetical protein